MAGPPYRNAVLFRSPAEQHGYIAESVTDSSVSAGSPTPTSGTLIVVRLWVPRNAQTSQVALIVATGGATFSNENKVALFSDDGTERLAITADLAADWGTTGGKEHDWLAAVNLESDTFYRVAVLPSATTPPVFRTGQGTSGTSNYGALSGQTLRGATGATGLTAMPSTIDVGALTASTVLVVALLE